MISEFKLVGLNRPLSFTCRTFDGDNIFWATSEMSQDRFDALWNYCKDNWKDKKIVKIEHEGFYSDGTPKNPKVIEIKEDK